MSVDGDGWVTKARKEMRNRNVDSRIPDHEDSRVRVVFMGAMVSGRCDGQGSKGPTAASWWSCSISRPSGKNQAKSIDCSLPFFLTIINAVNSLVTQS